MTLNQLEKLKIGELFSSDTRCCKLSVINECDTPIIKEFMSKYYSKEKLSYFGLSGAGLTDLQHWSEYISKGVSVEYLDNVYFEQIRSYFNNNIYKKFSSIDDILIIDEDIDNLMDPDKKESIYQCKIFEKYIPFTLINLDYYGSVIHTSSLTGTMKRIELLKKLFDLQRQKNNQIKYLLLLTIYHSGKDTGPETGDSQIKEKLEKITKGTQWESYAKEIFSYNKRIPLLSVSVPLFIAEAAQTNHTELRLRKKITYRDSSYWMIHFIFELVSHKLQSPTFDLNSIFQTPLEIVIEKNGIKEIAPYLTVDKNNNIIINEEIQYE